MAILIELFLVVVAPFGAVDTPAQDPSTHALRVRVLAGGKPVERAEVGWMAPTESPDWIQIEGSTPKAQRLRTGADGSVSLRVAAEEALVWAMAPGQYAQDVVTVAASRVLDLELLPDWDLTVRVEGPHGRPAAGVPVSLVHRYEGQEGMRYGRVVSSSEGVAGFEHAGAFLVAFQQMIQRYETPSQFLVRADLCVPRPAEVTVPMRKAPEKIPLLRVPPTGTLVVEARDSADHPISIDGPIWVRIAKDEEGWFGFGLEEGYCDDPDQYLARLQDGRGVLDRVGLGATFEVLAFRNQASWAAEVRGAGPTREGESATLVAVFGDVGTTFSGRAIDEADEPLVDRKIEVWLVHEEQNQDAPAWERWGSPFYHERLGTVRCDSDGRFRIDLIPPDEIEPELRLALLHRPNTAGALGALLALGDGGLATSRSFGDVVFAAPPVLAAGRVVDKSGAPIQGVQIGIDPEIRLSSFFERVATRTDAQGRFQLRNIELRDSFTVVASLESSPMVRVPDVARGTRDLEIVMVYGGAITGKLELPPGAMGSDFAVSLHRSDWEGDGVRPNVHGGFADDGTLFFDALEPGTWSVTIKRSDGGMMLPRIFDRIESPEDVAGIADQFEKLTRRPKPLRVVEDIPVRPGEITDIGSISLDDPPFVHVLHVTSAVTGEALHGKYVVRAAGAGVGLDYFTADGVTRFQRGEIRLLSRESPIDVVLGAAGHRVRVVRNLTGADSVALEPAIPVRFRLHPIDRRPPAPRQLAVELVPSGASGLFGMIDGETRSLPFDDRGEAILDAMLPGTYSLRWLVGRASEAGWSGRILEEESRATVTIEDTSADQIFLVTPPKEVTANPVDDR